MGHREVRNGTIGLMAASLVLAGCQDKQVQNRPWEEAAATRAASLKHQGMMGVQAAFPSAQLHAMPGGVVRLYGPALTTGASAIESTEQFRKSYAAAIGLDDGDLVLEAHQQEQAGGQTSPAIGLMADRTTGQPRLWLYRYTQNKAGVPVYRAGLRTLVRNDASNAVVWASSNVRALGGFSLPAGAQARAPDRDKSIRAIFPVTGSAGGRLPVPTSVAKVSEPELIVFAGTEDMEAPPRMAVQYTAETLPFGKWHFVADADTGDVLHVESVVSFADVNGSVTGNGTRDDVAMECAGVLTRPLPAAEVDGRLGEWAFADSSGNYVLSTSATGTIDITSLMRGRYFNVANFAGPVETLVDSVVPPGPANFVHNATNASTEVLAQVNAYLFSNEMRDFALRYVPTFPAIATELNLPVNVNISGADDPQCPGNMWYDPLGNSLNFCLAGMDWLGLNCTNIAFSSAGHHEYTHRLIQAAGAEGNQGEYGEGMADSMAALFSGQHGFGYGWYLNQCTIPLRDALNACQPDPAYCSTCAASPPPPVPPGEIHYCGMLLSGIIWDIRAALAVAYPSTYTDIINSLTLSSILLHTGTGINVQIAIDLLALDDNDGNPNNGTPHRAEICTGFALHGIPCPPLPANNPPVVDAGPDQTVTLPATASLSGTVSDDGLPSGTLTTTWSRVSGPDTVTFANPNAFATTATFSTPGTYVLRLTASDGALITHDDLSVAVQAPPSPCGGLCANPIVFNIAPYRDYQSGNLGTGAVCYQTSSTIAGGNCGNFASPRTLRVNGVTKTCNNQNWASVPVKRNGGYCIQTTTGNQPYAYFAVWRGAQ